MGHFIPSPLRFISLQFELEQDDEVVKEEG